MAEQIRQALYRKKQEAFLRRKQVEALTGLSRSSIYDAIQRGEFPKPIPLLGRTVAWTQSSVDQWIADRISAAEQGSTQGGGK
jgi:prophage regulatory protein